MINLHIKLNTYTRKIKLFITNIFYLVSTTRKNKRRHPQTKKKKKKRKKRKKSHKPSKIAAAIRKHSF